MSKANHVLLSGIGDGRLKRIWVGTSPCIRFMDALLLGFAIISSHDILVASEVCCW
jgi:hypothetical protein